MPREGIYFTYIVQCSTGTFYTGLTNNLNHRIKQHNGILKGGAKYTLQRKPVLLRFFEVHENYSLAVKREIALKKLPHEKKEKLCEVFVLPTSLQK